MDSTTYGAPSLNSDKVAVSKPESVPMETPKAQFFTKKCMAVSMLVLVLTSLVAVVCLVSLPSDEAENTDYGQMSISTDGSKFSGSGVISLMETMRDNMIQNVDIGEREETVSFKLVHEPIKGNLRRLTTIAAEELNATIHFSSMPADQVPPEVEQIDFNDTTAAMRVGVISDAEPNDLMLLDCSLIEGTCVVNSTVANYNATSSDRRLFNRKDPFGLNFRKWKPPTPEAISFGQMQCKSPCNLADRLSALLSGSGACKPICTMVMVTVYTFQRACFPASSQVITPSGLVAMDQTRPGMPVLTPTGFKPIYFMGDADQRVNSYVVLRTASGQQLTLSGDHFVQADGEYRFAKNVQIGQKILISNGSNSAVTSISFSFEQGAYNPYVEGGELIIDGGAASNGGIVASCHSSVGLFEGIVPDRYLPYIYEVLFKPILMIYYAKPKAIKVFHEMYVDQGAVSEHPITKISKDAVNALLA